MVLPHPLSRGEALVRIRKYLLRSWRRRYVNENKQISERWKKRYTGEFHFYLALMPCRGTIDVNHSNIEIKACVYLPIPLIGFFIEETIRKAMQEDVRFIMNVPDKEILEVYIGNYGEAS